MKCQERSTMFKKRNSNKKNKQSNFAKLSIFQPQKYKFKKNCPLSGKGAPIVDYKNIKLLKKYISEVEKHLIWQNYSVYFFCYYFFF